MPEATEARDIALMPLRGWRRRHKGEGWLGHAEVLPLPPESTPPAEVRNGIAMVKPAETPMKDFWRERAEEPGNAKANRSIKQSGQSDGDTGKADGALQVREQERRTDKAKQARRWQQRHQCAEYQSGDDSRPERGNILTHNPASGDGVAFCGLVGRLASAGISQCPASWMFVLLASESIFPLVFFFGISRAFWNDGSVARFAALC
jgi:hypothetical protein